MKRQDTAQIPGAEGSVGADLDAAQPQGAEVPDLPGRRPRFAGSRRLRILLILLCVPLLACLVYWLLGLVVLPDAAQVIELKGVVQTHGVRDDIWRPVQVNQLMRAKDWIRTAKEASARVRFFDVSTADLQENTEITIEQLGKRRQRDSGNVTVKLWAGEMAVRAVRLMDPSSSLRIETPTASTVVRGARFTVQVGEEGQTQIDLHEGSMDVAIGDEVVSLGMGERITTDAGSGYQRERVFEPNAQLLIDRIDAAWTAPGEAFRLDLSENEVNQFLAAISGQPGSPVRDAQLWFTDGRARIAATLLEPVEIDLSATIEVRVVNGRLDPQIKLNTAGVGLPLPTALLEQALKASLGQAQGQLDEAQAYVEFSEARIEDGRLLLVGRKRPSP
jgi:hypothetical protein